MKPLFRDEYLTVQSTTEKEREELRSLGYFFCHKEDASTEEWVRRYRFVDGHWEASIFEDEEDINAKGNSSSVEWQKLISKASEIREESTKYRMTS